MADSLSLPPIPDTQHPHRHWYFDTPLYLRILLCMMIGVGLGVVFGPKVEWLGMVSGLILKLLGALAPPLILFAILDTLLRTKIEGRVARKMFGLLILNTTVAIVIGLLVANIIRPGAWSTHLTPETPSTQPTAAHGNPLLALLDDIPSSLLKPLVDNNVIGVILIATGFGVALRRLTPAERAIPTIDDLVSLGFKLVTTVLHWVIELVPVGVLGIVASEVGKNGFGKLYALIAFVIAVIIALLLQTTYYLTRMRLGTWVRPVNVLKGMSDAIVMAFSTDSSTATMPVTYRCLKQNVGLREESARLGSLVGSNFNNDGTALYEAMAALFVAQLLGQNLDIGKQLLVILTAIVASVGAAGIPEAGLVTMTLVFTAVGLPKEYIGILITVDWFLDRCRTVVNMMGDVNVSCMLDGKIRPENSDTNQAVISSLGASPTPVSSPLA